jgi:hypothetical protein
MGTLANFTLSRRREILEKSSVNEILQDSLPERKNSAVPRTCEELRRKFSDLARKDFERRIPSTGLAPRSCEKDLSQTGAVFPIEESWTSKYLLLKTSSIFETACGLVQDKPNTFGSFPESNHASSAIQ